MGIDGWSGERFALPAETVAGRAFNRVVGKKAPTATSPGVATGLMAIDDSPGKAAAAAAAKSPLGAGDKSAGAPDPVKLFDAFEPLDGKSWVCIDPLRSDKYSFGMIVDLGPGSLLGKGSSLCKTEKGDMVVVQQIEVGKIPGLLVLARKNLFTLSGNLSLPEDEEDEPPLAAPLAGPGAASADLRDRLHGTVAKSSLGAVDGADGAGGGVGGGVVGDDVCILNVD